MQAPVTGGVVVSDGMARATWPGRSAIGQQLVLGDERLTVVE